ncbi:MULTISPECIES: macro domain-containing protein [Acidaminococcus]|uniref:macro domain-containing protein n=1 Tax=Acidaminococcus TaxID=904 RepID=UPI0025931FCA|nr:macro domain-containing protein [Acidaminococcus sp.]MDO5597234.1 macro domain-containing protein [Acidaminococcus sp.]
MPFHLVHADLTQMAVDAIVNAANSQLLAGGGVCGAIFRAVGSRTRDLQEECLEKAPCPTGKAVLTGGYGLKAKYIIHAVGPIWQGGKCHEKELLASCYQSSLELALENGCHSVAFPLISSGIFGVPKDLALEVARKAITGFLAEQEEELIVYLALFDKNAVELGERLDRELTHYIGTYYKQSPRRKRRVQRVREEAVCYSMEMDATAPMQTFQAPSVGAPPDSLENALGHVQKSFSQQLLALIDAKGLKDTDVYKRANLDRKLFSKIRSNKEYHPTKRTALALAVALQLSLSETEKLLQTAGYSLSPSIKDDVIVTFFLERGKPDLYEINEALFRYGDGEL